MENTFQDLYNTLFELLSDRKDLEECGTSMVTLFDSILNSINKSGLEELLIKVDALIDYCNERILLFHFKDVPYCWRRMLMDSGLLKASIQLLHILGETNEFKALEPRVQLIIQDLDTCAIVSGTPGKDRRWVTNHVLQELQGWLSNGRCSCTEPKFKKIKLNPVLHVDIQFPILRLSEPPSFEWFLNYCNQAVPEPIILPKQTIEHWPAFNEHPWASMDYLLSIASDRIVPVELGSQYTDHDWKQKMMRFSDFIDQHVLNTDEIGYLAQHDLFYQIPRLEQDILIPDYCYIEPKQTEFYEKKPADIIKNAWFGPKGTVSPLHQDPYHNLLCQVVGSKYLKLISPLQSDLVYPRHGLMTNTSQVNVDDPNFEQYPKYKQVDYVECVLNEGEVLYIPPKWWHYVKSLETSFSVSLWF